MKLLASDYDKTLKNSYIILKLNLKYLKKSLYNKSDCKRQRKCDTCRF